MTSTAEREHLMELINEATSSGSRIKPACAEAGIGFNTWQRWTKASEDQRSYAERPRPSNALTREERDEIIKRCNEPAFASKPPSQIVPTLLDNGIGEDPGVMPSFSRPRVSNDNPFIESLFMTTKYCPMWPSRSFESLAQTRQWVQRFASWYNTEHKHSALKFVTPDQKHGGLDVTVLRARQAHQEAARQDRPDRWSGKCRDWSPVT